MSRFSAFFEGLSFRSATPAFEPGEEIEAIVTGREDDTAVIRVGDTVLRAPGADVPVDAEVRVRVTSFDESGHRGEVEIVELLARP